MGLSLSTQKNLLSLVILLHAYMVVKGKSNLQPVLHWIVSRFLHLSISGVGAGTTALFATAQGSTSGSEYFKVFWKVVIGDVLGVAILMKFYRTLRAISRLSPRDLLNIVGGFGYWWAKKLPPVRAEIDKLKKKMEADIEHSIRPKEGYGPPNRVLPKEGVPDQELLSFMKNIRDKEIEKWRDGKVSGAVYHGGEDHLHVLNEAASLFHVTNPLHADLWPSITKFEAEVISMTANLLNGGDERVCGTITSGGTESILMAAKTHRKWGYEEKGITKPEIIACVTAHAAIDKACDILGITLVRVPMNPKTCQIDVKAVRRNITSDTILIYSSSPNFPQGIIDPIAELSRLAVKHNVGLHVDCCLGGFYLPFAKKLGAPIPTFDFSLPGVTSMSVDTHKYGYATKGTSVVLYRSKELRAHQYFNFANWTGGLYTTPTTAGSRPGALIAACWASMMRLGEKGYLDAIGKIMKTSEKLKAAIPTIPGLHLLGDPVAMVIAFGSNEFDIYKVSDKMAEKGYSLSPCQHPPCVHICVTLRHVDHIDQLINDLREVTEIVRKNPNFKQKSGNAPIYGMASSLPAGPVEEMLGTYCDVVLKA